MAQGMGGGGVPRPGLGGARAGCLHQGPAPAPGVQVVPVKATDDHDTQFNGAGALCPPPRGWVVRALRGCSPSSIWSGRRQKGACEDREGRPSRTEMT